MLSNLKISKKLLLGFGSILLVFIASAFVTRHYIKNSEVDSSYLANQVMQALELTSKLRGVANDVFITMRDVQYTERQEAIAEYRKHTARAVSVRDEIMKLNEDHPDLESSAYVMESVFPLTMKYMDLAENSIAIIEKKKTLVTEFSKVGLNLTKTARDILDNLHDMMAISVRNRNMDTNLTNAIILSSSLLEKNISLRRDVWYAISVAQSGGGIEGMRDLGVKVKELEKLNNDLSTFFYRAEDKKMLENMMSDLKTYEANLNEFIKTLLELDQANKARLTIMVKLDEEINIAQSKAVNRAKTISKTNSEILSFVVRVPFLSTLFAFVFGVFIIAFFAGKISKPLNTIVNLAKRAGDGDLTIKKEDFGYEGSDELGSMITALSNMVNSQNSAMSHIVEITKELADEARDLSAISEDTNGIMEEIRTTISQVNTLGESNGSALEQSNAGIEEMSAGADTVAKSATDSASFISQTTDSSNKAIQTVSNVIEGMRDVDKNAQKSEEKIRQLVSSVENVSSFVSVITGTADQTNLLALNAAIEAARAGEVGRGFAVVAEEVRKLAEESAKAANNVNSIINELQNGAQESIKATTEAGRLLTSTLSQAEHALIELNEALNQMNKANDSIQNIAAVAEEQAASSREVALSIDSVTKTTIDMVGNVSSINESASNAVKASGNVAKRADVITQHTKTLSDLLAEFKLSSAKPVNAKMLEVKR